MKRTFKLLTLCCIILNCALLTEPALASQAAKDLAIFILPDTAVGKEAKRLNAEIASKMNGMENVKNHYHITLFQGRFLEDQLPALFKAVDALAYRQFPIEMEPSLTSVADRNVRWNVKKTGDIQKLHEAVLKATDPYRHGTTRYYESSYLELDSDARQQADIYGSAGNLDQYTPHITLYYGQLRYTKIGEVASLLKPDLNFSTKSFTARTIAIGEVGEHGNLLNILHQSNMHR